MTNSNEQSIQQRAALSPSSLKKVADYTKFEFETTEQVPKLTNIVGQQRGRTVMNFGLNVHKPGYHLYVSGIEGTGKTSFVNSIIEDFAERETTLFDWCYVNNFEESHKPNVLKLPVGLGKNLKKSMENLVNDLKTDIPNAFNDDNYQKDRSSTIRKFKEKGEQIYKETNKIATAYGFVIQQSSSSILTIPIDEKGEPISEEAYHEMDETQIQEIEENSAKLQEFILSSTKTLRHLEKDLKNALAELDHQIALTAIGYHIEELKKTFKSCSDVVDYVKAVQKDLLT